MNLTCVTWRKSSRSTNNGGDCVELASASGAVAVRDSKDPDGPKLFVSRRAFAALLSDLSGDMNLTSAVWRKSSYTGPNGGECVELASASDTVAVRDSKDPDGPKLFVTRRAFAALLSDLKR